MLAALLAATHLVIPDDIPALLVEHGKVLGASDVALYLVDYEQRLLVPVPNPQGRTREAVVIDATIAGRSYRGVEILPTPVPGGGHRVWVPVIDGTERLGVLELLFPEDAWPGADEEEVHAFAGLVAELVITKGAYGDLFELVRRRQPMSVAAELVWQLLPPLTFATDEVVLTAVLAPAYHLGGDSYDYAVDAHTVRLAIFDAMGHGLEAGLLTSVALAAYRNSRRLRLSLADSVVHVDRAVATQFGDARFVTAVFAELDIASGRLRWSIAGHPRPLLLRNGKSVKTLAGEPSVPLGLGTAPELVEEVLEPGDQLLLFTDGLVEARLDNGEFFGVDGITDYVTRASASGAIVPETMRRLIHSILDHHSGDLQDDATLLLMEWRGDASNRLVV